MAKSKVYKSAAWLKLHYSDKKLSIDEIAALAGVSGRTIRSELKLKGLI